MSLSLFRRMPGLTTLCAAAALTLGAAAVHAQPYDDSAYASDDGATVGTIVVTPTYRSARTYNGAPVVMARATRVVDISDLDLSTGDGVHELHRRVSRAAADACNDLDMDWTQGLYPMPDDSDADCYHRAVGRAMRAEPISYNDSY